MQWIVVRSLLLSASLVIAPWSIARAQTGGERPLAVQELAPIATDDQPTFGLLPPEEQTDLWERIRRGFAMPDQIGRAHV